MRIPVLRSNPRLRHFDYRTPGAYFITAVTHDRACLFADSATLALNAAGRMIENSWRSLSRHFAIDLDEYVVMPNHIHGIVILPAEGNVRIGTIIGAFKSTTTVLYGRGVVAEGWPRFAGKLWQRNYHEHVIRDPRDLERVREYVANNPASWVFDEENLFRRVP